MQQKVAKKSLTIASYGRGGGAIAARSRQLPVPHNNPEAPHDVLLDHHRHNGVPHAPDPVYLVSLADELQANGGTRPSVAIQDDDDNMIQDSVTAEPCTGPNKNPKTFKFYDVMWKAILNRAKLLSHLDAVINDAFPERYVYISKRGVEFINQAITELEEDNVQPNKAFLRKHQHHMSDLVGFHPLPPFLLTSV